MKRIDDAVMRILLLKFKLGLFDNPYPEPGTEVNFGKPEYQEIALQAALESMTLLKNDNNILPLAKPSRILVAGPGAQSISTLNGCWSYTWQGKDEQWYPDDHRTIYRAIAEKVGYGNVVTTTAKAFDDPKNYDIDAMVALAPAVDAIILCLGEDAYAESPGNTPDLALPRQQEALAEAAVATGKPVILILTQGRPQFITNIEPGLKGILLAYWGGKKTAEAVADVLFGDFNPSGRLPFSYSRSMGDIVMYDRKPTEEIREVFNDNLGTGYDPLYPFGHGLSYTTFEYSNLVLSSNTMKGDEYLEINITVSNTGDRSGQHAVELYTRDMYASVTPCMKRLRAFRKISLDPGESQVVSFTLNKHDLAFVNADLQTITEPGEFRVLIGDLEAVFIYSE